MAKPLQTDRAALRSRLTDVFRTDADLTAFCMDYFQEVAERFSTEMSRQTKLNLLLELRDVLEIHAKIDEHLAKCSRNRGSDAEKARTRTVWAATLSIGLCFVLLGALALLSSNINLAPTPTPFWTRMIDPLLQNPPAQNPMVSFVMEVFQPDGTTRIVEPSEILCSGESFRLSVEVDTPSYLYIAQGRNGHGQLLYPPEQSNPVNLLPGRVYSLPENGKLELDTKAGLEQVFLLASPKPLGSFSIVQFVEQALRSAEPPVAPRGERSCSLPITKNPDTALKPSTDPVYKEIVLRQNLPRQVLANTTLVRIPIVHQ